jgi:hypothetical protein
VEAAKLLGFAQNILLDPNMVEVCLDDPFSCIKYLDVTVEKKMAYRGKGVHRVNYNHPTDVEVGEPVKL